MLLARPAMRAIAGCCAAGLVIAAVAVVAAVAEANVATRAIPLPKCSLEPYPCGECSSHHGCGCGACVMDEYATCVVNETAPGGGICGMECAPGTTIFSCGLSCLQCLPDSGYDPGYSPWLSTLCVIFVVGGLASLMVLNCVRRTGMILRYRRFRRWIQHPTVETLGRDLDRRTLSRRACDAGEDLPEGLECSVCLSEFSPTEFVRTLPCPAAGERGHSFHRECIDRWLWTNRKCPLCNADCAQLMGLRVHTAEPSEPVAQPAAGSHPDIELQDGQASGASVPLTTAASPS